MPTILTSIISLLPPDIPSLECCIVTEYDRLSSGHFLLWTNSWAQMPSIELSLIFKTQSSLPPCCHAETMCPTGCPTCSIFTGRCINAPVFTNDEISFFLRYTPLCVSFSPSGLHVPNTNIGCVSVCVLYTLSVQYNIMQFIEDTLASLHASWYVMAFFTVLPMVVSVPRQLTFVFLLMYAIASACLVLYGIPEQPQTSSVTRLQSEFDDKTRIFRAIRLQSP